MGTALEDVVGQGSKVRGQRAGRGKREQNVQDVNTDHSHSLKIEKETHQTL